MTKILVPRFQVQLARQIGRAELDGGQPGLADAFATTTTFSWSVSSPP